jgi:hypothetical protein
MRGDFTEGDLILIDELNEQLVMERHADSATDFGQAEMWRPEDMGSGIVINGDLGMNLDVDVDQDVTDGEYR